MSAISLVNLWISRFPDLVAVRDRQPVSERFVPIVTEFSGCVTDISRL